MVSSKQTFCLSAPTHLCRTIYNILATSPCPIDREGWITERTYRARSFYSCISGVQGRYRVLAERFTGATQRRTQHGVAHLHAYLYISKSDNLAIWCSSLSDRRRRPIQGRQQECSNCWRLSVFWCSTECVRSYASMPVRAYHVMISGSFRATIEAQANGHM